MSTPSKSLRSSCEKTVEPAASVTSKPNCNSKILYLNDDIIGSEDVKIIKLKHPRNHSSAMYVCDCSKNELYEFTTYDEEFRSWFVDNTVVSNGKIYITTKMDITYLILPYLIKTEKNVPLDHLLEDSDYPDMSFVADLCGDLSHVAKPKGNSELKVWCYDEALCMNWLEKRTKSLSTVLQNKKIPLTVSAQYHKSFGEEEEAQAYLSLAHGIISEYLSEELEESLKRHLKIPEQSLKQKALEPSPDTPKPKKPKVEEPLEDYSIKNKQTGKVKSVNSAKSKALAKSAVGTKTISSFFTKK